MSKELGQWEELKEQELQQVDGGFVALVVLAARGVAAAAKIPAVQKAAAGVAIGVGAYIGWDITRK